MNELCRFYRILLMGSRTGTDSLYCSYFYEIGDNSYLFEEHRTAVRSSAVGTTLSWPRRAPQRPDCFLWRGAPLAAAPCSCNARIVRQSARASPERSSPLEAPAATWGRGSGGRVTLINCSLEAEQLGSSAHCFWRGENFCEPTTGQPHQHSQNSTLSHGQLLIWPVWDECLSPHWPLVTPSPPG